MAIYRNVQLSFWTDNKVLDDFTPEDRYFYLYLFTNPQTNLCGCYEFSWKAMSNQTGYSKDTLERLLDRFQQEHKVIEFSPNTREILLLNWYKYNWTKSKDFQSALIKQINEVKDSRFRAYLFEMLDGGGTVYTRSKAGGGTTVTDTVTDTITNSYSDSIKEIIDYLNITTNSHYTYKNKNTNRNINARLAEGHTVEDFKTVIDKKSSQWLKDPKMIGFLRPETLFSVGHFESYLNEKIVVDKIASRVSEVDNWV